MEYNALSKESRYVNSKNGAKLNIERTIGINEAAVKAIKSILGTIESYTKETFKTSR